MKKMKFFAATLSLTLAGALCLGLVACGDSDDPFKSDAWKMKSEEVTQEQWTEAFKRESFDNAKIEVLTSYEGKISTEQGSEQGKYVTKTTLIVAGDVEYYKTETTVKEGSQELKDMAKELNDEVYSQKGTGNSYTAVYKNKDGEWRQCPTGGGAASGYLSMYLSYGNYYKLFKFQGADAGYMTNMEADDLSSEEIMMATEMWGVRLKFKDGKLAAIFSELSTTETTETDEGNGSFSSSTVSVGTTTTAITISYGGQSLTVPTPGSSAYAGTWKTHQLIIDGTTYNVGDSLPAGVLGAGEVPLTADMTEFEAGNDGTATSKSPAGDVTGIWRESYRGIQFSSSYMYMDLEYDGTYLKADVSDQFQMPNVTLVFVKA